MKDNFSRNSDAYAQYRPKYPDTLAQWIAEQAPGKGLVWDCATGNGQMATVLANHFDRVVATDLSSKQLELAVPAPKVEYRCEPAHQSSLPDHSADAVVVAQAFHWFDFDAFYSEVRRVLRPGGLIAIVGYPLMEPEHPAIQNALLHFYNITVGPYWDPERNYLEEEYVSIPFPFDEIPFEERYVTYQWDMDTMIGFLNSWSAVSHYINERGTNPVRTFIPELEMVWPKGEKTKMHFKIVGRVGRV